MAKLDLTPLSAIDGFVGAALVDSDSGMALAKLGGGPDAVAKVVEKAITARKPSIRYRVTPSAHLAIGQRRLMTAGMWDAMLRTQFPQPGKKR